MEGNKMRQAETELWLSIWQRRSSPFGYQADSAKPFFSKPRSALETEPRSNEISPQAGVALWSFGKLLQKPKRFLLSPEWRLTLFPKAAAGRFPLLLSCPCSCRAKVAAEIPFCLHLAFPPRQICFVFLGGHHLPPPILFGGVGGDGEQGEYLNRDKSSRKSCFVDGKTLTASRDGASCL